MSANGQGLSFIIEDTTTGKKRNLEKRPFAGPTRDKLYAFCEIAQSLAESSFVTNPLNRKGSLSFGNDGSVTNQGVQPSDEEIGAFLHKLRPIYLNDEETNFNLIANIVKKHIDDEDVTKAVKYWQQYYDGRDSQKTFEIKIKGKILNSNEFFDNYINALEYHRDQKRRQYIDLIAESFPLDAQKAIFVLLLGLKVKAIIKLASFVLNCLQKEDGQPIILRMPSFHPDDSKPVSLPKHLGS